MNYGSPGRHPTRIGRFHPIEMRSDRAGTLTLGRTRPRVREMTFGDVKRSIDGGFAAAAA